MKLAVVSLVYKPTALESKGGAEVWASNFVLEHAQRGHQIDLYALRGSLTGRNITLVPTLDKSICDYYEDSYFRKEAPIAFGKRASELKAMVYSQILNEVRRREEEYDVIIDSTASPLFPFNAHAFRKPMLTIGHDPPVAFNFYSKVFGEHPKSTVVFPSRFQFEHAESIPEQGKVVIPHGIALASFRAEEGRGEYMLWMSRIDYPHMDKGVHDAMFVANILGKKLRVTGFVEPGSRTYVDNTLRALITPDIMFEEQGASMPVDKNALFGSAKLFLFPTQWEEPFGIVMLEAMACGTPVVAYARGAIPEVIVNGVTGFIVTPSDNDKRGDFVIKKTGCDGLCEAVERIYAMNPEEYAQMRKNCRAHVEKHFTVERMVDQYEELYARLLK